MKFGPVPVGEAEGAILAHSLRLQSGRRLRKGVILEPEMIAALASEGVDEITVARLESGDIGEDEAASRIAAELAGDHIRVEGAATGRVNLYATANGLFEVDVDAVNRLNRIDPAITLATLANHADVATGRMVATVKIIPYAVAGDSVEAAATEAGAGKLAVAAYDPRDVAVISTTLPALKASVIDKTVDHLQRRLDASGSKLVADIRVAHDSAAVAQAIASAPAHDLVIVFGASATSDANDVVPAAIEEAGGSVSRFGMPVDPGNLLVVGEIAGRPVIGAPGCARSPAENGFDWVLQRILADRPATEDDIASMGVGGLLMEIGSRPRPRERRDAGAGKVAAIVLAAGQSRRMGVANKLLAKLAGEALVRRIARTAAESAAHRVIVVTGHEADRVGGELTGLDVTVTHNAAYADGLSTSLASGIAALGDDAAAAVIMLADMPAIEPAMIDKMIARWRQAPAGSIIVATHNGKRGNPVLWPREYFARLSTISGDVGARGVLGENRDAVVEVELGPAAGLDLDTPQAMEAAGGKLGD